MSNIRIHRKVSDLHNDLFCWICTHLPGVTGFYRVSSTPAPNRDESPPQSNKRRFWWENQNKRDAQKRFSSIFFVLRFPFFFGGFSTVWPFHFHCVGEPHGVKQTDAGTSLFFRHPRYFFCRMTFADLPFIFPFRLFSDIFRMRLGRPWGKYPVVGKLLIGSSDIPRSSDNADLLH